MGVELGKVLAKNILAQLNRPEDVKGHDNSVRLVFVFHKSIVLMQPFSFQTTGLIHYYQQHRRE